MDGVVARLRQVPHAYVIICCGTLAVAVVLLAIRKPRGSFLSEPGSRRAPVLVADVAVSSAGSLTLDGVYETVHEREVVWQIPSSPPGGKLQGVAFYAHGCTHSARDFWPKSQSCPRCVGLPEDVALVRHALSRGYAVIAVSSLDTCWDVAVPASASEDIKGVGLVLDTWRAEHELGDPLPLVALGASSGGYFISCLAHRVKLDALVIIIASGVAKAFTTPTELGLTYPPTLFVHMPKDSLTAFRVARNMKILEDIGVETAEIRCLEMRLTEGFFASRIDGVSEKTSGEVFRALAEGGLVNATGYLLPEYRDSWKGILQDRGLLGDGSVGPSNRLGPSLVELELVDKINEELHLAFAYHEMTSQHAADIVDWFQGVCTSHNEDRHSRCKSYGVKE